SEEEGPRKCRGGLWKHGTNGKGRPESLESIRVELRLPGTLYPNRPDDRKRRGRARSSSWELSREPTPSIFPAWRARGRISGLGGFPNEQKPQASPGNRPCCRESSVRGVRPSRVSV